MFCVIVHNKNVTYLCQKHLFYEAPNKSNRQFTLHYEVCDAKNEDLGIF